MRKVDFLAWNWWFFSGKGILSSLVKFSYENHFQPNWSTFRPPKWPKLIFFSWNCWFVWLMVVTVFGCCGRYCSLFLAGRWLCCIMFEVLIRKWVKWTFWLEIDDFLVGKGYCLLLWSFLMKINFSQFGALLGPQNDQNWLFWLN